MSGVNFEGPAPRPLERYKIVLQADGKIKVDKTKVFRQEKGEWDNTDSFIAV
jgi:cytochrome b6-f complex iron-sulfur subunit